MLNSFLLSGLVLFCLIRKWCLEVYTIFSYKFQEEAVELEEILAKRQKRGKQVDDKPLEEKTVLHSK
jgi:hypothetical protein